jgi:hypothetical protein
MRSPLPFARRPSCRRAGLRLGAVARRAVPGVQPRRQGVALPFRLCGSVALAGGEGPHGRSDAERPGNYSYWVLGDGGKGSVATLGPGQSSANVPLSDGAKSLQVLDDTSGTVASLDVAKAKDGAKLSLSPADFTLLRSVAVKVTAGGGKPVEKAVVTLTDAAGESREQVLTSAEAGVARFDNVPMGKATVSAAYGEGGTEKATQETAVAPAKGGGPLEVTLALSGNVPTLAAPAAAGATGDLPLPGAPGAPGSPQQPQTIVVNAGQQEAPRSNDWVAGVIGIVLLGAGGAYLFRYAKERGITVKDALKQIGVETPQEVSVAAGACGPPPRWRRRCRRCRISRPPARRPRPLASRRRRAPVSGRGSSGSAGRCKAQSTRSRGPAFRWAGTPRTPCRSRQTRPRAADTRASPWPVRAPSR